MRRREVGAAGPSDPRPRSIDDACGVTRCLSLPRRLGHRSRPAICANALSPLPPFACRGCRWLATRPPNSWDLAVIYYGDNPNFSCKECVAVIRAKGVKLRLLYDVLTDKRGPLHIDKLDAKYTYFMMMDDDIITTGTNIARGMEIGQSYGLQLWQPSLCDGSNMHARLLRQDPAGGLRFTSWVEVMMPAIRIHDALPLLLPIFRDSVVGWVDYAFAHLLHYPHDKIAVIDEWCATHPPGQHGLSVYQEARKTSNKTGYDEILELCERYDIPHRFTGFPHTFATLEILPPATQRVYSVVTKEELDAHMNGIGSKAERKGESVEDASKGAQKHGEAAKESKNEREEKGDAEMTETGSASAQKSATPPASLKRYALAQIALVVTVAQGVQDALLAKRLTEVWIAMVVLFDAAVAMWLSRVFRGDAHRTQQARPIKGSDPEKAAVDTV